MIGHKKVIACLGTITAAAVIVGALIANYQRETVLEFGMFTGSNWNVANANSFISFDKAIARFEKEHPGVKIHYYSGISKDDYSEWFSRKLLAGKEPDVFMILGTDFNQFSSMEVMVLSQEPLPDYCHF